MGGKIGVLALQGAFQKQVEKIRALGVDACEVRTDAELASCAGLILPGGESTTIWSLNTLPLRTFGRPLFGTCAGLIILARLGLLDIRVARNAYGRQAHSFSAHVTAHLEGTSHSFHALFIRAPRILDFDEKKVEVLARLPDQEGSPIAIRQGNCLGTTFHPELTEDPLFHRYFLQKMCLL